MVTPDAGEEDVEGDIGVGDGEPPGGGQPLVDRADEHDPDRLPLEHPGDELRVRRLRELVEVDAALVGARRAGDRAVPLAAESIDLRLEVLPLRIRDEPLPGEPDPDEDPEHERHEHGGERRDVVAQVEHLAAR